MKTYNALSKSFTDEIKTIMGVGKSIDEAFEDVKSAIIDNNFGEPTPTPKPIDVNELTQGDGQQDGFYYVDLGLSVKWATCNVGADLASDEGKLFQFGRVDGYRYNDSSNQFRTNAQNKQDTGNEYIPKTASGKTYNASETLQPADDAAHVNMGGKWKMPTQTQYSEMFNNTTHTVIKDLKNKQKVIGMLFTSKINNKRLFVPFAGYWYNGNFSAAGSSANVWSSQVHPSRVDNAYSLRCGSSGYANIGNYFRSYAFSVRGVFQV